jgi:CHAD domain-containing protein
MTSMTVPAERPELGERLRTTTGDPPAHHVRVALDTRLRALLKHEPGTRSGDDPEDLHQMRVAVRRMRAVLRASRSLLDRAWADALRAELGWLGWALGPVRDLDVLLERLRGEAAELGPDDAAAAAPMLDVLIRERAAAREAMLQALDSDRYPALLRRLATAVADPLPVAGSADAHPDLHRLVTREFERLSKAVTAAGDDPPDEVLHDLRIRGKRLRYTAELAEPAIGTPARELIKATVAMQDVLGEHQDACVAQQRVRALLDDAAAHEASAGLRTALAAGRLVEREETRRLNTRAAWPEAWRGVQAAASRL